MIRQTSRREFLARSAAGALVLGLPSCFQKTPHAGKPKFLEEALAKIQREDRPGIVIRIPNDRSERELLGKALVQYVDGKDGAATDRLFGLLPHPTVTDFEVHELFLEAVFVCLEEGEIDMWIAGADPNESLVLIDGHGRRVDGARPTVADLTAAPSFLRDVGGLLHGPGLGRLAERASSTKRFVPTTNSAALDRYLASNSIPPDFETNFPDAVDRAREGACRLRCVPEAEKEDPYRGGMLLATADPSLSPAEVRAILQGADGSTSNLIVRRLEEGRSPRSWRIRALLETQFLFAAESESFQALPFGLGVDGVRDYATACGLVSSESREGALISCGMGYTGPVARRFVGFLAE